MTTQEKIIMNISLIIPVFNQAQYLADAIDSALDQILKCEIIVVNDGSTDNSGEIADRYKDRGVKVIHQINKGLASARNTGIMNATGEYILFLDADDLLKENCLIKLVENIEINFEDIYCWDFKEFGVRNGEVRLTVPTLEAMKTANRMAYCSAFKRSALLEIGGYSPRMIWGYEDYSMTIDLLKRGKTIAHIPEILFLYRTKEQSMLTDALKHHEELMNQIKKDHYEFT